MLLVERSGFGLNELLGLTRPYGAVGVSEIAMRPARRLQSRPRALPESTANLQVRLAGRGSSK